MQKQGELQFLGAVAYGVEEMFVPFGGSCQMDIYCFLALAINYCPFF